MLLLHLICFLLIVTNAQAIEWNLIAPKPLGVGVTGSSHASDGSTWLTCEFGEVFRSTDNGVTFERLPQHFNKHLIGVSAKSRDTAVLIGEGGYVVQTHDGGLTWDSLALPIVDTIFSIARSSSNRLLFGYSKGRLLEFENEASWTVHDFEQPDVIWRISTFKHYVAVGVGGRVWCRESDAGEWRRYTVPDVTGFSYVGIDTTSTVWAGNGTVAVNIDLKSGRLRPANTFVQGDYLCTKDGVNVLSIVFGNSVNNVLVTHDGGLSAMTKIPNPHAADIVWFGDSTYGVFGQNGNLTRTTDNGHTWNSSPKVTPRFSNHLVSVGGSIYAFSEYSDSIIWVSEDVGKTWAAIVLPYNGMTIDLYKFVSPMEIYVAGYGSLTMYGTLDGGKSWTRLEDSLRYRYLTIDGGGDTLYSTEYYYADFKDSTRIRRSLNRGVDWEIAAILPGGLGKFFIGSNGNILIPRGEQTILMSSDGGIHWSTQSADNSRHYIIGITSDGTVWASSSDSLYISTDNARSWRPVLDIPVEVVHELSPGVIGFRSGTSWRISTDRGNTWSVDSVTAGLYVYSTIRTSTGTIMGLTSRQPPSLVEVKFDRILSVPNETRPLDAERCAEWLACAIYSLSGQLQFHVEPEISQDHLSLLPAGLWLVVGTCSNGQRTVRKVITY